MSCYKCGGTEDLSLRAQRKSTGYKLYMCRPCRNAYSAYWRPAKETLTGSELKDIEWRYKAFETVNRLSKRSIVSA